MSYALRHLQVARTRLFQLQPCVHLVGGSSLGKHAWDSKLRSMHAQVRAQVSCCSMICIDAINAIDIGVYWGDPLRLKASRSEGS